MDNYRRAVDQDILAEPGEAQSFKSISGEKISVQASHFPAAYRAGKLWTRWANSRRLKEDRKGSAGSSRYRTGNASDRKNAQASFEACAQSDLLEGECVRERTSTRDHVARSERDRLTTA